MTATVERRALAKFSVGDGCWLWNAGRSGGGYGSFWNGECQIAAHRFVYEMLVGPVPEGLVLDHLCRVPQCVRPDHLDPVTQAENTQRGTRWVGKVACPKGHTYDDSNTYRPTSGGRRCRACHRERQRRWVARNQGRN